MTKLIKAERLDAPRRIATEHDAREGFEADFGRPPRPGEIERIVDEQWKKHFEARTFLVREMANACNSTVEILAPFNVQLVWPRQSSRVEFGFADNPLVHSSGLRVTALEGLALGDADRVYFPVGPRLAALFTSRPIPDGQLTDTQVQMLNLQSWKAALAFLGASTPTPSNHCSSGILPGGLTAVRVPFCENDARACARVSRPRGARRHDSGSV
jgi:hypothetical protein